MEWNEIKLILDAESGLSRDAMHVIAGVIGQVAAALLLRLRIGTPWPWLVVLIAALANEWLDLRLEAWPDRASQWAESVKDVLITMLLPTLLLALSRYVPALFGRCAPEDDEEVQS